MRALRSAILMGVVLNFISRLVVVDARLFPLMCVFPLTLCNIVGIALVLSCIGVWGLWRLCVVCDVGSLYGRVVVVRVG